MIRLQCGRPPDAPTKKCLGCREIKRVEIRRITGKIDIVDRKKSRLLAFVFGLIALVTLSLLAISVNALRFDPGLPFPLQYLLPNFIESGASSEVLQVLLPAVRILILLGWIFLPFTIVYLILSKRARVQLLKDLAFILPVIFFLYLIAQAMMNANFSNDAVKPSLPSKQALLDSLHLPPYVQPPVWVNTAALLVIAVFIAFVIYQVILLFWRARRQSANDALAVVRREIQGTLTSIEAGDDLHNAITQCYLKMVDTIKEYRQVSRDQDMTPHEFEHYLELYGLPHDPVHRLTQLFEKVRYGALMPDSADEKEARESLSLIIAACQQTQG